MIRLEQARLDARMTIDDLAERAGVSVDTIYRLERGQFGARDKTLFALADELGIAPSELLRPVDGANEEIAA